MAGQDLCEYMLPLLFARGRIRKLETLTLNELRRFLMYLVPACLGATGQRLHWWNIPKPDWWPDTLPFIDFPTYQCPNPELLKTLMATTIKDCYTFHRSMQILDFCNDFAERPPEEIKLRKYYFKGVKMNDLIEKSTNNILVSFTEYNRIYDFPRQRSNSTPSVHRLLPVSRSGNAEKPCVIFLCDECDAEFDSEPMFLQHVRVCGKASTSSVHQHEPRVAKKNLLAALDIFPVKNAKVKKPERRKEYKFKFMSQFYSVPYTSPLGKLVYSDLRAEPVRELSKEMQKCISRPHIPRLPDASHYPVVFRQNRRTQNAWTHQYCFNKADKREQKRVFRTGLNRESRLLLKKCKNLKVVIRKAPRSTIKYWTQKRSQKLLKMLKRPTSLPHQKKLNTGTSRTAAPQFVRSNMSPIVCLNPITFPRSHPQPTEDSDDEITILEKPPPKFVGKPRGRIPQAGENAVPRNLSSGRKSPPKIQKVIGEAVTKNPVTGVKRPVTAVEKGVSKPLTIEGKVVPRHPLVVERATPVIVEKPIPSGLTIRKSDVPRTLTIVEKMQPKTPSILSGVKLPPSISITPVAHSHVEPTKQISPVVANSTSSKESSNHPRQQGSARVASNQVPQHSQMASPNTNRRRLHSTLRKRGVAFSCKSQEDVEIVDLSSSEDEVSILEDSKENGGVDWKSSRSPSYQPDVVLVDDLPKNELRHWPETLSVYSSLMANGDSKDLSPKERVRKFLGELLDDEVLGPALLNNLRDLYSSESKMEHSFSLNISEDALKTQMNFRSPRRKLFRERPFYEGKHWNLGNIPQSPPVKRKSHSRELQRLEQDECKELNRMGLEALRGKRQLQTRSSGPRKRTREEQAVLHELQKLSSDECKELKRQGLLLLQACQDEESVLTRQKSQYFMPNIS